MLRNRVLGGIKSNVELATSKFILSDKHQVKCRFRELYSAHI